MNIQSNDGWTDPSWRSSGEVGARRPRPIPHTGAYFRAVSANRSRATSSYARFIGRFGVLAVALGIGGAIAASPEIAYADDSPPTAGSEQPSESAPDTTDPSSTSPDPSPSTSNAETTGSPATDPDPTTIVAGSQKETTLDDGVVVRSSGGALTSGEGEIDETSSDPADPQESSTDEGSEYADSGVSSTPSEARSALAKNHEISDTTSQSSASSPANTSLSAMRVDHEKDADLTSADHAVSLRTATADTNGEVDVIPTMSLMHTTVAPTPVAAQPAGGPIVHAIITVAFNILDAVLTPFLGPIPTPYARHPAAVGSAGHGSGSQFAEALQVGPSAPTAQTVAAVDEGVYPPGEATRGQPAGLPAELERTTLVSGLNQPTDFRFLPDGSILIAEKGGAIKLYHDGHVHDDPLITLAVLQTDTDEERGLLGIEVDPDFEHNGYIYVSYTTAQNHDRLSRLTVTGRHGRPCIRGRPAGVRPAGQRVPSRRRDPFGPDGKLYWAMGMNTNNPNSQNLSNVHGKILRLNPDGTAPADNPFVDTPGAVTQIWAYGLRNPFRFTFTPDGKLLAGDVGGTPSKNSTS